MPCYYPLSAWLTEGGEVVFAERGSIVRALVLPCGRCVGCRVDRSRDWAIRCVHEAQVSACSSYVTLTYNDESCPASLCYSDFQKFMKRLRRFVEYRDENNKLIRPRISFFMCGEYGELGGRPHYHACLFGVHFGDRVVHAEQGNGFPLYRSDSLSKLWPHGFASIGEVSFDSAAYVARYVMKKITGPMAEDHYRRVDVRTGEVVDVEPEFCRMSLNPGIGQRWFDEFWRDVFGQEKDGVVVRGKQYPAPRFYLNKLKEKDPELFEVVSLNRYRRSGLGREDRTVERLAVREHCAKARLNSKQRVLE